MNLFKIIFQILMVPFAGIYRVLTGIRNWFYDRRILSSHSVNVPVISIGNITAGGTGKTPFVIALANWLSEAGYSPGIITRGYRRQSKGRHVVRDRNAILSTPLQSGDEPFLIASNTKQTVIIADADRVAAAETAVQMYACDIVIADDAFQHRRLERDIDIVLWDASQNPKTSSILPAGRLRESIKGLRRADLLLISRTDSISSSNADYFKKLNPNLFLSALPMSIRQISNLSTTEVITPADLKKMHVLGFCGIGNPAQFFNTIKILTEITPVTKSFPDHYKYSITDLNALIQQAENTGCRYLVTTRKDAVNLPDSAKSVRNLLVIDIHYTIDEKIKAAILNKLPPRN
ncbi:tetraacyldisaccharide 4'-kinase [bacterium]|nr:tetraacyldisaccharide 4'-kinase [bacterium]MBU1633752.1 tetraacyldisaccharide 4'-kinase [bacterium]MBU1873020.1 tetraacyldisaccharide 4'-kinase [bacterium]